MRVLARVFLFSFAPIVSTSCVTPQSSVPQPELVTYTAIDWLDTPVTEAISPNPDLSYWDNRTSLPNREIDLYLEGFACGLVYPEPVAPGQWVFIGISENPNYTPILDIYSDRTGNSSTNSTVYYHFKLTDWD